jgi:DRG Family Regulatory Proteins, Tma46/Zinc finger C-x8-C-x5-C-x3-H type (and similar)
LLLCLRLSLTSNRSSLRKVIYKVAMKLSIGEDPKTVLCAFFKAGACEKGKKCKFSHDMSLDGKASKIDIYTDPRDRNGKAPERTDIICKNFIEAVEKDLYGWFWECPNGGDKCVYTHAVPPGYIFDKDRKEMERAKLMGENDDDELTLEEKIEEERASLPSTGLTPVTLATFQDWKKRKAERKQKELEEKMKEESKKGSKGFLSGKALFKYDPTLFKDDEEAADEDIYQERNEDEEEEKQV